MRDYEKIRLNSFYCRNGFIPERVSCKHQFASGRELRLQPRKAVVGNAGCLPRQVMQVDRVKKHYKQLDTMV